MKDALRKLDEIMAIASGMPNMHYHMACLRAVHEEFMARYQLQQKAIFDHRRQRAEMENRRVGRGAFYD